MVVGVVVVVVVVVVLVSDEDLLLLPPVVVVEPLLGAVIVSVEENALVFEPRDMATVAVPAVTGVTVNCNCLCAPAATEMVPLVESPVIVTRPEL